MNNQCVKTGARVHVVEYGGVAPADLFLVGGVIIARFGCGHTIDLDYSAEAVEHASHRLQLGQTGWYRADLGVAVAPIEQLEGMLVGHAGQPLNPADVARRFRPLLTDCPDCDGGGSLTLEHSSRNPQLEVDVSCPRCHGLGEIEVDQAVINELEHKAAKLDKLEERLAGARASLARVAKEMRERKVNHGNESPTLVAWAARIEGALAQVVA